MLIGKSIATVVGTVVVFLFCIFVGLNSWTTVPAGHGKVGTLFGKVQPTPLVAGFHVINPLVKFTKFDLKDQSYTWDNVGVPAQDKLTSTMDVTVIFDTDILATPEMLRTVGNLDAMVSKHVTKKVFSVMREVGKSVKESQSFFTEETQLYMQSYMDQNLREYFEPKGIQIKSVLFSDVRLPSVVTAAVIKTKERQEELNREKAQLQIVEQQQLAKVKSAEADYKASVESAKAIKVNADAEAYKIAAEADAQSKANTKLSKSVSPALVDYIRANNWNGVLPSTMLADGTNMLVSVK